MKETLLKFLRSPRRLILLTLLASFFLPWISYGFIVKSGFDLPLYSEDLKSMFRFFTQGERELPKEIVYIYGLYLYPLMVFLLFFIRSRYLTLFVGLLPLLPFLLAVKLLPIDITPYLGFGFFLLIAGSIALSVEGLFRPKKL